MKFIEAKQVPEVETVVHLVMASSDTRHSVATAADLELKSKQRYEDTARAPPDIIAPQFYTRETLRRHQQK